MGKKKPFIQKKNAITYRLIDKDEKIATDDVEMDYNKNPKEDPMEELTKCGIYYDDDYNYMQHLKSRDEPITTDGVEKFVITLPTNAIKFPKTIIERNEKETILEITEEVSTDDPEVSEIDTLLENSEEIGEIEDDFIALAGGLLNEEASSSKMSKQAEISQRFQKYRECNNSMGSNDDSDLDHEDDCLDSDDDADAEKNSNLEPPPNRNPAEQFFDNQFDKIIDDYGDEKLGEGDIEEDIGGCIEPDSNRFTDLVTEYQSKRSKITFNELDKPDDELMRKTLKAAELEDEKPEETVRITVEKFGGKRNRWDCESILSTYSNQYNHPTLICEPPRKKANGVSKKVLEKMDTDVVSIASRTSVSTYRPKDETPEERRARKSAIKEERRERRQEKKQNKLAFKAEKKQMDIQTIKAPIKGIPLK